eukprot:392674-Rhodomonas_salina.1
MSFVMGQPGLNFSSSRGARTALWQQVAAEEKALEVLHENQMNGNGHAHMQPPQPSPEAAKRNERKNLQDAMERRNAETKLAMAEQQVRKATSAEQSAKQIMDEAVEVGEDFKTLLKSCTTPRDLLNTLHRKNLKLQSEQDIFKLLTSYTNVQRELYGDRLSKENKRHMKIIDKLQEELLKKCRATKPASSVTNQNGEATRWNQTWLTTHGADSGCAAARTGGRCAMPPGISPRRA